MEDLQEDLSVTEELVAPAIEESTVDPLKELQSQLADAKDQYLRARAETENIRKRTFEEVTKARKFAIEGFAENLMPVIDTLYAALEHAEEESKKGLEVILEQMKSAFAKGNLQEINPLAGDQFDPHKHQAISMVSSEQQANTIVSVLQRGYTIAERVLRPAMVTVSKEIEEKTVDTIEENK